MPGVAPRVRFAPSPTGYFHVGSARTALFNWLVARRTGGTFVLRIEDTDAERNREEWVDGILAALAWLGMEADEGPYRQSARTDRYRLAIDLLWEAGSLYACDCTREEVEARAKAAGVLTPGYDGHCRDRGLAREAGPGERPRALRFRTPDEGTVVVDDVVRGRVEFPCSALDDFVAVKANGGPLFVLANVVDDIDMAITHVIRGEDLLPTTPRGILVWRALAAAGWQPEGTSAGGAASSDPSGPLEDGPAEDELTSGAERIPLPAFAHLPMLVNEQRKKLSKRRDPVAVERYRDEGYLPQAFVNYLALLGWSPPVDRELFSVDELVSWFDLADVNHSPAFFDVAKLTHLNGEHVRALSTEAFVEACTPWTTGPFARWSAEDFDPEVFARMAPLVQERVAVLGEVPDMVDFFFTDEVEIDPASWQKAVAGDEGAGQLLDAAATAYRELAAAGTWTADALHQATERVAESAGRKLGKAQAPVRVAVTGRRVGPPLFESMEVLGPERVLERIERARAALGGPGGAGTA